MSDKKPFLKRLCAGIAAATLAMGVLVPAANADERGDKERRKQTVESQINQLRQDLSETEADLSNAYIKLAETEAMIPQAQERLNAAQRDLRAAEEKDRVTGERLQTAQDEKQRLEGETQKASDAANRVSENRDKIALAAYKGGGLPSAASVFVGISDPAEALDRSKNYQLALQTQSEQLGIHRTQESISRSSSSRLAAVENDIARLKRESEESVRQRTAAQQEAEQARQELDALYANQRSQAGDLESRKAQYQAREDQLQSESAALDRDIQRLLAEEKKREEERLARERAEQERLEREQRRAEEAARKAGRPAPARPKRKSSSGSSYSGSSSGGFIRPSNAPISSSFGYRFHPIYHRMKLHAGTDFAGSCGTPVRATRSGRVLYARFNGAAGRKVMLVHGIVNGRLITSSYHHLQGFAVSSGQQVSQGQVVGWIGTTGSSTGCHLHFEIHEDGSPVNAMKYL
ncbi:peptidoglycan DD-metalloendopeptidase family protein [Dermabacteraceae bacterium P13101]